MHRSTSACEPRPGDTLFTMPPPSHFKGETQPDFDGSSYEPAKDQKRLATQLEKVKAALLTGNWWTLDELAHKCGGSAPGVSARIRDLRKQEYGSHIIDRRRRGNPADGLHEYRMVS